MTDEIDVKRVVFASDILLPLTVSLLWGFTTPLIKKYGFTRTEGSLFYLLFSNWKYLLSLLTNQLGSLIFVYSLRDNDLSLVSPMVNALTFVFVFICGRIVGEETDSLMSYFGALLILIGTSLCILEKPFFDAS